VGPGRIQRLCQGMGGWVGGTTRGGGGGVHCAAEGGVSLGTEFCSTIVFWDKGRAEVKARTSWRGKALTDDDNMQQQQLYKGCINPCLALLFNLKG
jgi:hypothetical protein